MQETRSSFRVQKTVLVAAAAGCLALSFMSPISVAAANDADAEPELGYCPRPGSEIVADGQQDMIGTETEEAGTEQAEPVELLPDSQTPALQASEPDALRVATYNANLSRDVAGDLFEALSAPGAEDATAAARVIQTVRPDVLVLTGIDVDAGENLAKAFNTNYLAVGGDEHTGITYPYSYTAPSNAGVDSGADLDRNGTIGDAGDSLGYGKFPGQSSMIVYSKYPLDTDNVRDFTSLPWKTMPDNNIPADLTDLERDVLPLASVSHWDIPVEVDGEMLHVLATSTADASVSSYGTARNHDQIQFWQDYLDPDTEYILDHRGTRGPLADDASFVIAGSLKADPTGKGPADPMAITSLLASDQIIDPEPARTITSKTMSRGVIPDTSNSQHHTAPTPGDNAETYRADYVLLSSDLSVTDSGVLETGTDASEPDSAFIGIQSGDNANHIVWADVAIGR